MLPYSRGLLLDNPNNYGIVKTETLFGFGPHEDYVDRINTSEPLEWIFTRGNFAPRSLQVSGEPKQSRGFQVEVTTPKPRTYKKTKKSQKHLKKKRKGKVKKCIVKFLNKGGEGQGGDKKRRKGNRYQKMQKKYMLPVILGLLAAKSLLIPIALKALAFLSAKGLMMGFFSTVLASVLSLKGMFDHSHGYQNRKDDTKTQVEIIQVPSKSEDHIYYNDEHYRRGDLVRGDLVRGDLVRDDFVRGVVRGNSVREDLVKGDLVRGDLIHGDLVRDDFVRGVVGGNPVQEDLVRGNLVREDFDREDLVRDDLVRGVVRGNSVRGDLVRGDLVRQDFDRGDLVRDNFVRGVVRGNSVREDLVSGNLVRGDFDVGDIVREDLARGDLVPVLVNRKIN